MSEFYYFCLLFEFGLEIAAEHTQSDLVNPTDPVTTQSSYFLFIVNVIHAFMDCQFSTCLFSGYKVLIKLDSLWGVLSQIISDVVGYLSLSCPLAWYAAK